MITTENNLAKYGWSKLGNHGYTKSIDNQKWALMIDNDYNVLGMGCIEKEKKPLTAEIIETLDAECKRLKKRSNERSYDRDKVMPYVELYFQGKMKLSEIVKTGLIRKSPLMHLIEYERKKRNENK